MKLMLTLLASFCLTQVGLCTAQPVETVVKEEPSADWMTFYYKSPSPERFVDEVRALTDSGVFKDRNSQPSFIAFLSQVMVQNPKKVAGWLKEFEDLDEKQHTVVLAAAWYSNTEAAQTYFKEKKLKAWAEQDSPSILEMKVDNPATLDMLWGYFMATGEQSPIQRIVSAFQLSKYSGAAKRYRESKQTEQDQKEAWLDATFQAAQWSLETNCSQHPKVLEHCEAILRDKGTPKAESLWLALVLAKVKPEMYKIEIGDKESTTKSNSK